MSPRSGTAALRRLKPIQRGAIKLFNVFQIERYISQILNIFQRNAIFKQLFLHLKYEQNMESMERRTEIMLLRKRYASSSGVLKCQYTLKQRNEKVYYKKLQKSLFIYVLQKYFSENFRKIHRKTSMK